MYHSSSSRRPRCSGAFALAFLLLTSRVSNCFQLQHTPSTSVRLYQSSQSGNAGTRSNQVLFVQDYLKEHHGLFFDLVLSKNDQAWKRLSEAASLTIFAVTDQGMRSGNMGDAKLAQLRDQRNEETVLRMAEYHMIANDAVSAQALFDSGGIVTIGPNVVPVERTKTAASGFLSFFSGGGGTEDGGVTVGGAKVVSTVELANGNAIVHATDNVISPRMLWRYCDQLRIPGSK